jgi:hypothetical protein
MFVLSCFDVAVDGICSMGVDQNPIVSHNPP